MNLPRLHATIFHLSLRKRPHQIICSLPHGDYENGPKLKATLVDNLRRAHTEDTRAKENPSGENCSDSEAHRRCYSAKGVQPWIIARFTSSLNNRSSLRKRSPASCGAFLRSEGTLSRSGLNCLALRHTFVRCHCAPRNALMDCLRGKAKLAPRDITILARTTPEDRMLDGKRYYRAFPDENPERPSVRAVLDALQKLEAQFPKHITQFRANQPEPK